MLLRYPKRKAEYKETLHSRNAVRRAMASRHIYIKRGNLMKKRIAVAAGIAVALEVVGTGLSATSYADPAPPIKPGWYKMLPADDGVFGVRVAHDCGPGCFTVNNVEGERSSKLWPAQQYRFDGKVWRGGNIWTIGARSADGVLFHRDGGARALLVPV
ncbi:MAG: hypothetical protein K2X52_27150 [Mycobacteriaceae bacterium]|nr:hypothetical protein [Mycobacteriaceae bacterium]